MKKEHKNIDDIFKRGLEEPIDEIGFDGRDWDALEEMMDKGKKKPGNVVYLLRIISGVAALLLVFFGWWLLKPASTNDTTNKPPVAKITRPQPEKSAADPVTSKNDGIVSGTAKGTLADVKTVDMATVKRVYTPNPQGKPFERTAMQQPVAEAPLIARITDPVTPGTEAALPPASKTGVTLTTDESPVIAARTIVSPVIAKNISEGPEAVSNNWADEEKPGRSKASKAIASTLGFKPQLSLSLIAASELNGNNALSQSNRGSNLGVLFSVGIKKLTITTGAMYSVKPYSANGGNYYSYASASKYGNTPAVPQTIAVDCRMLDIPLNIDYQLYNKRNNKISVGSGLSSYIMTHESYKYTYADPSAKAPAEYYVKSPGHYLFSVMNLQATYQHQLNSKIGVSVQPYFKVPLSSIGYSQVKLQSLGVAVGLNWNINSLSKPK